MGNNAKTGISPSLTRFTASGHKSGNSINGSMSWLSAFWQSSFSSAEPIRFSDLVIFPLGISATAGLLSLWSTAHQHFLDPAFVGYSIVVHVCVQAIILLPALALASITRRRLWSGVLFAIGFFCFLQIPELVKLMLPGVVHRLAWVLAVLGAFQIARVINLHRHSRFAPWMIAVPAVAAFCAFSYAPGRELYQLQTLPAPPPSPNVLVIIVDTLRADHLSPYGYSRDTSPNLANLAQQGVLFENAISPSSWTLPSHASMLTGLYPHETRVETDKDELAATIPTLGSVLSKRGYRTAAFSANYFLFCKTRGFVHGFSRFEDYEQTVAGILQQVPLSQFILEKLSQFTSGIPDAYFGHKNAASAETINNNAIRWIRKEQRPFFLVLNYIDLHEPVLPPEPYLHVYTRNANARNLSLNFQQECSWADAESSCDSDRPEFLDTYDGAIRYVDTSILHLLAQLKQSGVLQNTLVVFTSDHGQEFGNHGIYGHGKSLYLGEIHVPLIFWKPGMVPASVRVPTPVSTSDIAATVLDLAAPDGKQVLPGSSLTALWRSSQPVSSWPEPISELARLHWFSKQAPNYNQPVSSIVTPQWQYIHQEDKDFLFDWKTDPHETIDLCSSKPIVCSELKARSQATRESRTQEHDHMDLSSASKAGQVRLPNAPPQSVIWKKWS